MPIKSNKGFAIVPILVLFLLISIGVYFGYSYFYSNNSNYLTLESENSENVLAATGYSSDINNFIYKNLFGVSSIDEFNKISSPIILSKDQNFKNCSFMPRAGSSFTVRYGFGNKINTATVYPDTTIQILPKVSDNQKYLAVFLNPGSAINIKDVQSKVLNSCTPQLTLIKQSGSITQTNFYDLINTQPVNKINDGAARATFTFNKADNGSVEVIVKPLNTSDDTILAIYRAVKKIGITIDYRPFNGNEILRSGSYKPDLCSKPELECAREFKISLKDISPARFAGNFRMPVFDNQTQWIAVDNIKNKNAGSQFFKINAIYNKEKDVVELVFSSESPVDANLICTTLKRFGVLVSGKTKYFPANCSPTENRFSVILAAPAVYAENWRNMNIEGVGRPFQIPFNNTAYTYSLDVNFPKFGPKKFDLSISKTPGKLKIKDNEVIVVTITPTEDSKRRNLEVYNYFKANGFTIKTKTSTEKMVAPKCLNVSDCSAGFQFISNTLVKDFSDIIWKDNASIMLGTANKNIPDVSIPPIR